MNSTREEVVRQMCLSYRPDFDIEKAETDPPWIHGMTAREREGLLRTMTALYDEHLAKLMPKKRR